MSHGIIVRDCGKQIVIEEWQEDQFKHPDIPGTDLVKKMFYHFHVSNIHWVDLGRCVSHNVSSGSTGILCC